MALRALIIANGTFTDAGIPPLRSPVSDALRLQALLADPDVGPYDVQICADFDSYTLKKSVERFFKSAESSDRQLLFFSGHGFKHGPDSRLYFAAKDTERETLRSSSLSARFVFEEASLSFAQQTIIFIDSCYSGAFVRGHVLKSSDQIVARDDFEVSGAHGMAIITASSSVQTAAELVIDDYSQSIFTHHLIDGIKSGGADASNSGMINLDGLLSHIRKKMRTDAPGQQPTPHFFGLDGTVEIARNPVKLPEVKPVPTLSRALIRKIASKNADIRLSACPELYFHAEKNPAAVDLVRSELDRLTSDRDDLVKREAQHQLKRMSDRFPPIEQDQEAEPKREPQSQAQPVTGASIDSGDNPGPRSGLSELIDPDKPVAPTETVEGSKVRSGFMSVNDPTGEPHVPPEQPKNQKPATPQPAKPEHDNPDWFDPHLPIKQVLHRAPPIIGRWTVMTLAVIGLIAVPFVIYSLSITPVADTAPTGPIASTKAAPAPKPGEWLIGEWVINQSPGICTPRVIISRGSAENELVFSDPDSSAESGDTDTFTVVSDTVLTTEGGWRYRRNRDGSVTVRIIDESPKGLPPGAETRELRKCERSTL